MHRNLLCLTLSSVNTSLVKAIYEYGTFFPSLVDSVNYRSIRPINVSRKDDGCYTELSLPLECKEETLRGLREFQDAHEDNKIGGILCLIDRYQPLAAYLSGQLGLVGLNESAARLVSDKYLMKQALFDSGLTTHPFRLASTPHDLAEFGRENGYPIVVKPTIRSGGTGVMAVHGEADVERAFAFASDKSGGEAVLAEVFLDGDEISVEGVSFDDTHHVLGVTDKTVTPGPYFVETRHTIPSKTSEQVLSQVYNVLEKALEALGIMNCCWHIEVKIAPGGPVVNEVHGRLPGGRITELVRIARGIDMDSIAIAVSMGDPLEPYHLAPKYERAAGIQYLLPDKNGCNYVKNYFSVWQDPAVRDFRLSLTSDCNRCDNSNRVGYVIAEAKTAVEAERVLENAVKKLDFF